MLDVSKGTGMGLVATVVAVLSLCLAGPVSAATVSSSPASAWSVVPSAGVPGSSDSRLSGVSCTSTKACMAVGSSQAPGYSMFAELWDGSTWTLQTIPSASAAAGQTGVLSAVSCSSKTACTAVGYWEEANGSTLPLAEAWNGASWTRQSVPSPTGSSSSVLSAVSCPSPVACTAVGYSDISPTGDFVTLAETWNGSTWAIESTPNPTKASQLLGVSCVSAKHCSAVGSGQQPPPMGPRAGSDTLAEAWNGTKWAIQATPPLASSQLGELSGVSCTAASACTAVGYSGLPGAAVPLADIWNGRTWTAEATPGVTGAQAVQLYDVSCPSTSACTAVGAAIFTDRIDTLVEAWNGKTWTIQPTPDPSVNSLSAVSCTSAKACTAVGYSYNATSDSYLAVIEAN